MAGVDKRGAGVVFGDMATKSTGIQATKQRIEIARQTFLFGGQDGLPVTDTRKLSAASGVSIHTVKKHMPEWVKERETLLRSATNSDIGLNLSPETVKQHEADVTFLREQMEISKSELDNLDLFLDSLEGLVDKIAAREDIDGDQVLSLFSKYLQGSANRKAINSQFLQLQKAWKDSSGMASKINIWEASQKEAQRGKARLAAKEAEVDLVKSKGLEVVPIQAQGVFARRKAGE